jgi:hypothetical protein
MPQYTQQQLYEISCKIMDRFEEVNEVFGLNLVRGSKYYSGKCPIHEGADNPTALNIYHSGNFKAGNWACRSNQCEKHFQSGCSILSFIRSLLSVQNGWKGSRDKDKIVSFGKVLRFCETFLGEINLINKEVDWAQIEKQKFTALFKQKEKVVVKDKISREEVRQRLIIPSPYFVSRGFSKEILDKYDIGDCLTKGKPMNGRAVIPVYDDDNLYMVGSTGRSIYGLCDKCNCYHAGDMGCPEVSLRNIYSKWKNNFDKSNFLYNHWFAKPHIRKLGSIILVESPGNVLRLEEAGIKNSVGLFGLNLSDAQRFLLNLSGATTIITIFDNDENQAGQQAAATIAEKLKRLYHVINYLPKQNDIAEMPISVVKEEILPILEKVG